MIELKMSDVFEFPVRASQLEVYGANSNPEITFDDIENAAAHAINNHDRLTSENARLRELNREFAEFAKRQGWQHVLIDECYKLEEKGNE